VTLSFGQSLRDYANRVNSTYDPTDPSNVSHTGTSMALRNVVAPTPDVSYFSSGTRYASNARTLPTGRAGGFVGVPAQGDETVPGPLSIWEPASKNRPHEQVGKFGTSLMGTQSGFTPGVPTPFTDYPDPAERLRQMAAPDNPDNRGFVEGLLGGLGGLFGEAGRGVGAAIGSAVDLPFEAAGNIAGLPFAALSASPYWLEYAEGKEGIDPDLKALWQEAAEDNPVNGLLMWGHVAKAQWQRDLQAGRVTGLMGDVGPATSLTDQLGLFMQLTFGAASRATQRAIVGTGFKAEDLDQIQSAARRGNMEDVANEQWRGIAERLERGDFGRIGSQEARDRMLDQLVVQSGAGALLRQPDDPEQKADGFPFVTAQGLLDFGLEIVTDPTVLASFGVGGIAKFAKVGTMALDRRPGCRTRRGDQGGGGDGHAAGQVRHARAGVG